MTSRDDAVVSQRRLQELTAQGFPLTFVADLVLSTPEALYAIRAGHRTRVQYAIHRGIADAHRQLHGTDPATHGIASGPICAARLKAARNGWTTNTTTTRKDNP